MNQSRAPISEAIQAHLAKERAAFHIHAHRGASGAPACLADLLGEKVFRADLTELPGLDDLYEPTGPIREAQELAAAAYGSDRCRFLVNGTSSGNIAMILASVKRGEKILLDAEAHRSAHAGVELAGAVPVPLPRKKNARWNISEGIDPEMVRAALAGDPEIRAVFLVSPTYYGISSSLREIAAICHAAGIPLLVDEAHGAHFHFSGLLPEDALSSGADLVAQSTHKTAGSLGQSSLLHQSGTRVDANLLDEKLRLVTTSSPSYILMASLDVARRQMATEGEALIRRAYEMAEHLREKLSAIRGLEVLSDASFGAGPLINDPLRLVFSAAESGISGHELANRLHAAGISTELSDERNVLALITWGNTFEDVELLKNEIESAMGAKP